MWKSKILFKLCLVLGSFLTTNAFESTYALNIGGFNHTDTSGVHYEGYHNCTVAIAFRAFANVPEHDRMMYRECCRSASLNFQIPVSGADNYLLILKLLPSSNSNINVTLNKNHQILRDFNVENTVGGSEIAYDEYIVFSVCGHHMQYKNEYSFLNNNTIDLDISNNENGFAQVSGLVLYKGDVQNFKVAPIAKNFNTDDFIQQAKHECVHYREKEMSTVDPLVAATAKTQ
jgi:hypothetical protein